MKVHPILETKRKTMHITSLALVMLGMVFSGSFSWDSQHSQAIENNTTEVQSKVLGAYTEIPAKFRGEINKEISKPILKGVFSTSTIQAGAFLVYDQASGEILAQYNQQEKLPIASITKLITGLLAYENLNFHDYITIPSVYFVKDNPVLHLRWGDEVKLGDVFNAMLIGSENDAAQLLAKVVELKTGKSFVNLMNKKAQELGMSNTNFSNPLGFYSLYNYSTAEDLKKLVDETQKYPTFTDISRLASYTFDSKQGNRYYSTTTNKLIKTHSDIYAIKTGYTRESLGSMVTKIDVDGHKIIVIILNSEDREGDTLKLKKMVEENVDWN